jgi:alcohol dehydrogenase, propanol-preferring
MKAMILDHVGDVASSPLQLRDIPMPVPGPGDVLVKVHVCAVCRTDLHVIEGELADVKRPLVPGHQVVGTVTQVGAGVTEVHEGDRVGIAWLQGPVASVISARVNGRICV